MLTRPRGSSLGRLGDEADARFGDATTLVFEGAEQTASELGAGARRLAGGLAGIGVRPGDRVAVCMANCPEVLQAYRAAWRLGASVVPLMFLLSEHELRHALADSGAVAVITTPEFLPKITDAVAGLEVRPIVTGDATDGALSLIDLMTADEAPLADVDPASMGVLLYTGGTTGRSKGVVLSHDAVSSAAWSATRARLELDHPTSLLPLPLAHAYGILVATMGLHATQPGRTVLMRWFDPAGWLELAERERVHTGALVPTMLRLLLTQPLEERDLSTLARLTSGSAPLPGEILDQWAQRVPHVEIAEGYGCSEVAALATTSPPHDVRRGSVGPAAPGVELRISGPDGRPVPAGTDGEVCVRSPGLMTGYWHDDDATRAAVRDGWFHTGDIGHVDDDGFLYVVDRLKDVIIRGGFNVYPRDVEEALLRHPDVAVCAVVGRPDEAHGEEIVAYVQRVPGGTARPEELIAFAREHLSAVKYPREVHLVDTVPLTSIGKLDRKALRVNRP